MRMFLYYGTGDPRASPQAGHLSHHNHIGAYRDRLTVTGHSAA